MWVRILLFLFHLLPSFIDIGSDVLNSLDFLGYNVSTVIYNPFTFTFNASMATTATDSREDFIWGYFTIGLIFAPGIPLALSLIIDGYKDKCAWFIAIPALCYPLFMLGMQLVGFFEDDLNQMVFGWEAYFESSPQMVLQLFTIQYGYPVTSLQIFSIILSFFFAAKTSICYDLLSTNAAFTDWKETWIYIISVIPVYATGIIFRIGAQALITAYLRYWSFIPILIQAAMYGVFTVVQGYHKSDIPLAVIANLANMTRGAGDKTDAKAAWSFMVTSTIFTFFFECFFLVIILVFVNFDPSFMDHQAALIFFEYSNHVVGGIIMVGLLNLLLLYVTRAELKNPEDKPIFAALTSYFYLCLR